jgi:hypothetical protein
VRPECGANPEISMEDEKKPKKTHELRCPKDQCGCSPRGKLLATLIDAPPELFGSGAVIQLTCPSRKSRLLRIRL